MGCYGVTDDLNDEINYWKRENKKLLKEKKKLEQELNILDNALGQLRERISECFRVVNKQNKQYNEKSK